MPTILCQHNNNNNYNNDNNHNAKEIVQDMTTQDSYNYKAANHYI